MQEAKLLKVDENIEEEVTIEIHRTRLVGFSSICPYKLIINNTYQINLGLTFLEDQKIAVLDVPRKGLERIGETYQYILYGEVCGGAIDIGDGIRIEDDIFIEYSYLENTFVEIRVDRLSVEFI